MARHEIPKRWAKARMATLDIEAVKEYADSMVENVEEGRGIILTGPPGCGKSWGLAALTVAFQREASKLPEKLPSKDYVYITAPEFFDCIPVFGESEDTYRGKPYITTFSTVPWLVVNDLGKEYRGGKLDEQIPMKLGRILRTRCENMLPTHISSNLDMDGIKATYGTSIVSILREMCSAYHVGGEDRRFKPLRAIPGGKKTA